MEMKNSNKTEKFEKETDKFGYIRFVSIVFDIDLHSAYMSVLMSNLSSF